MCMVATTFREENAIDLVALKAKVVAHFESYDIPIYQTPWLDQPEHVGMIVLKKYVFGDHPDNYIEWVFKKIGIWDFSYTGWRLEVWEKNNGKVE